MTHVSVRRGMLYVTVAAAIWGTGGPAAAVLYRVSGLGPVAVSFWRFVFGALLLFAAARLARLGDRRTGITHRPAEAHVTPAKAQVASVQAHSQDAGIRARRPHIGGRQPAVRVRRPEVRGQRLEVRERRSGWAGLVLVGAGLAVSQAAYFGAVAASGVAVATATTLGASPALVALGARLLLAERLGRRGAISMGLALAGLALLMGGPSGGSVTGIGLALLSAVAYAGVTLLSRHSGRSDHSRTAGTAMWGFAVGGVLLLPVAAAEGLLPSGGAMASVALLGYLGAMPTALAYSLFFAGLASVRATTASVVALLEPAGATVLGVLVLGERLTATSAAGAAVLLASVAVLATGEQSESPRQDGSG
ncbi:DMT family transporter [Sphaerisporangium rhizosphaerae]|uniref:DMT family transporter n=1 Tax=Sphaerisporangium rhizosphaerae TaxID=2269375 RepID=A0ABW2PDH2_9ACTN